MCRKHLDTVFLNVFVIFGSFLQNHTNFCYFFDLLQHSLWLWPLPPAYQWLSQHQLLQHEHIPTRRAAIQELAVQPRMESLELFLTALQDEDPQVRLHAAEALQELSGEHLHQRPEAWRWWFDQQRALQVDRFLGDAVN